MRTTPSPLKAALTASPRKTAECLILEARDGTRAGFTTWDETLKLDLGFGAGEEDCDRGMNLSAMTQVAGFDVSNFEFSGALKDPFHRAAVLGGRWRRAKAWLVRVSPGVEGYQPLMYGRVSDCRVDDTRFILEVRNPMADLIQSQGSVLTPYCRAKFGDDRCKVERVPVSAEVTAVVDAFRFTLDIGGTYADDYFNLGTVGFQTGALAGTDEATVLDFDGTTGAVELMEPLVATPEIGDELEIHRGCSKLRMSDDPSIPTCLTYENVVNFRGFTEVPSNRFYHRVSATGTSYA